MEDTNRPLALVTGASSGIGYKLARQFVEHGFDTVVAVIEGTSKIIPETARAEMHRRLSEPGSGKG
jgi:NAD(P)-dependent dehydrogenase (short-subunit alcohol dehydrogenase family)